MKVTFESTINSFMKYNICGLSNKYGFFTISKVQDRTVDEKSVHNSNNLAMLFAITEFSFFSG